MLINVPNSAPNSYLSSGFHTLFYDIDSLKRTNIYNSYRLLEKRGYRPTLIYILIAVYIAYYTIVAPISRQYSAMPTLPVSVKGYI